MTFKLKREAEVARSWGSEKGRIFQGEGVLSAMESKKQISAEKLKKALNCWSAGLGLEGWEQRKGGGSVEAVPRGQITVSLPWAFLLSRPLPTSPSCYRSDWSPG